MHVLTDAPMGHSLGLAQDRGAITAMTIAVAQYPVVSQGPSDNVNADISKAMDRYIQSEEIQFWGLLVAMVVGLPALAFALFRGRK